MRPGRRAGRYGSMSFGSLIIEHMLPPMSAPLRFVSADLGAGKERERMRDRQGGNGTSALL